MLQCPGSYTNPSLFVHTRYTQATHALHTSGIQEAHTRHAAADLLTRWPPFAYTTGMNPTTSRDSVWDTYVQAPDRRSKARAAKALAMRRYRARVRGEDVPAGAYYPPLTNGTGRPKAEAETETRARDREPSPKSNGPGGEPGPEPESPNPPLAEGGL